MRAIEAFFDESGSHAGSTVLCVAGLILDSAAVQNLNADWTVLLGRFGLPFFRMSACAHRTAPFDVLTRQQCIDVATCAIAIVRKYITYGMAVTLDPREYDAIVPGDSPEIGSPYSLCTHMCLTAVRGWAHTHSYQGQISYFFESGHRSQAEADQLMSRIFSKPQLRAEHRYVSHAFAGKESMCALQAADLIAWQWHTDHKRRIEGKKTTPRLDCAELMKLDAQGRELYHVVHFTPALLREVARPVLQQRHPLTYVPPRSKI